MLTDISYAVTYRLWQRIKKTKQTKLVFFSVTYRPWERLEKSKLGEVSYSVTGKDWTKVNFGEVSYSVTTYLRKAGTEVCSEK